MSTQSSLYPPTPPRSKPQIVPLADIAIDSAFKPHGWLVDSVRESGLWCPVVLADNGDDKYTVLEGRRRLVASQMAGLTEVAANVFDSDDVPNPEAVACALNNLRNNNSVVEFESIVALVKKGFDVERIARATGITVPSVKAALALGTLSPVFLVALHDNRIKYSVARKISKLSRDAQGKLVELFETKQGLTAKDVRPYWIAEQSTPQSGDVFEGDPVAEWTTSAIRILRQLVAQAPRGTNFNGLLDDLRCAIAALEGEEDEDLITVTAFKATLPTVNN